MLVILLLSALLLCTGCREEQVPKETSRTGYLKAAEDHFFYFNEITWVSLEDEDLIEELGLDADVDMPGGFYVHDEKVEWEIVDPAETVTYTVLDPYPDAREVTRPIFRSLLMERGEILVRIHYADGVSTDIIEQYLP